MNLTSLFNFKYLKENLKRSKAIILLSIFLIPVINVIIYLMRSVNNGDYAPSIFDISTLSVVGMYVVPVILSITLFSFVYKRKSSDFVMSFPVTKRQIFISNTVGGIIVLLFMNIVNLILILFSTILLSNVLIDYEMIFDMFMLWTISYIFVFICTNIAISVSSNKITTVVVTLLVLFLIPFVHTFISSDSFRGDGNDIVSTYCDNDSCKPTYYECNSTTCEINRKNNIYMYTSYMEVIDTNYTIPYALILNGVFEFESNYNINSALIKMSFLSVLYIILGVFLFDRRKFEVVETSFKSEAVHIFIRSLTTIPILCIYYIILKESFVGFSDLFTILFLFALLIAYVIIYDLLTRKKITNIFKSLAALIVVGIMVIFTGELAGKQEEILDVNDIDTIAFLDNNLSTGMGYTYNRKIINYVMSIHMDNIFNEEGYYEYLNVRITMNDNSYRFNIAVTLEQYNFIMNSLSEDKTYLSTSKKLNSDDVFAINLGEDVCYISSDDELYGKLIDKFKNSSSVVGIDYNNDIFNTEMFVYNDYAVNTIKFNIYDDKELMQDILNYYNLKVKMAFDNPDISIDSYYIGNFNVENYFSSYDYDYSEIDKFILDNLDEDVDINKPYMYIKFYSFSDYTDFYIFFTNNVDALNSIISRIQEENDVLGDV